MKKTKFNAAHMVIGGFFLAILTGTLLLMLPVSSVSGQWTKPLDALFTATTSVCVTGLVVVPTFAYWSLFGKLVILALIQVGGFGIICLTMGFFVIIGRKISLKERRLIQETYNMDSNKGVIRHVIAIIKGTFILEGIGAILYSTVFIPEYGMVRGIWYSVFHAVSAFCNAGIDVIGNGSFMPYQTNVVVNLTTVMLIISGGIGFVVWWDLGKIFRMVKNRQLTLRKIPERMTLHAKLAIIITAILVFGGTFFIMILEFDNPATIGNMSFGNKLLSSLFESVTLRTAGFCTIDQTGFRSASYIILCLLMLIGGSPMGTAGGIKTTTFGMLFITVASVVRGKNNTEVLKRRVSNDSIKTALSVTMITVSVLTVAIMFLSVTEDASLKQIVFEATSALGTVGLSMNFTTCLSVAGRIIIIILMFFGRVGPVTIAIALARRKRAYNHIKDLPERNILIG